MRITEPYTIFKRKLASGRYVYYYQYRDDYGRRSAAYSTGTDNFAKAKRIVKQMYNDGKFSSFSTMKFSVFAKDFFVDGGQYQKNLELKNKKISKSSSVIYTRALDVVIMPFFGDMLLGKITTITVREFKQWALANGHSKNSINIALGVLAVLMRNAEERQILVKLPKIERFPKEKKDRTLLTIDEVSVFMGTLKNVMYGKSVYEEKFFYLFALLFCTGMRIGEALGLKPENLYKDYADVKYSFSPRFGLGPTKTKKKRFVPIPKKLADCLRKISSKEWVFPHEKENCPAKKFLINYFFEIVLKEMGIDKKERGITIHSLRGFFISHLREKNVPDAKIRAVVGHADPSMTDVYTYWKPDMFPEVNKVQQELYEKITGVQNERIC